MNRNRILVALALAVSLAPSRADGQVEIDRRRAAPAKGEVWIENPFGTVTVRGWERAEVQVRGVLAAGADELDFDGDKEGVQVSVGVPDAWFHATGEDAAFRSTLEVFVPAGAQVEIRTVNAGVDVQAVTGPVSVSTVNGAVRIAAGRDPIEVETMTGTVEVRAQGAPVEIESISGAVTVLGAAGEVAVESVSGKLDVGGTSLERMQLKTTTGPVVFRGSVAARDGRVEIETFSGPVSVVLPKATRATFELGTFGGEIQSDFCAGTPVTRERFEPFRKLHCSTGEGGSEIQVTTHDADIVLAAE
jgi:DUF4097 and DUF4098 domain-containing protein YvlB